MATARAGSGPAPANGGLDWQLGDGPVRRLVAAVAVAAVSIAAARVSTAAGAQATGSAGEPAAADAQGLDERYAKALQTELGLLLAIDAIDQNADKLDAEVTRLSADMAKATDELLEAERQRAGAEAQLEAMRTAVQARLRAVQRISRLPTLRFALSQRDFALSVNKDRLLRQLLVRDKERLAAYRKQLADLEPLTRERDTRLQQLKQLEITLHAQKAKAEQERRDKVALITQLSADRRYHERMRRDLSAADRALVEKIQTLQEWTDRKYPFTMGQGTLMPPVVGRVEQGYGEVRNPRFGTTTLHRGIDYRGGRGPGQSVRAVFWGRVAFAGWLTGYGDTIILDHGRGWHTVYAHLEELKVSVGDVVKARDRIAEMGQSGSLKGRYLYFEIRHNGQPVDPAEWML